MGTNEQDTSEAVPEDRVSKLEAELEQTRRSIEVERVRAEKLSSLLTQTQQDLAETTRFMRTTLPDLTSAWGKKKSFEDQWADSPEVAVKSTTEESLQPVERKMDRMELAQERLNAKIAFTEIITAEPELAKYAKEVREIWGNRFPDKTKTAEGIRELFEKAQLEEFKKSQTTLHGKQEKVVSAEMDESKKDRAYMEGSSPSQSTAKPTLTPEERRVASRLGVKEKDYLAFKMRGDSKSPENRGRPKDWKREAS